MGIAEDAADLAGGQALFGKLADELLGFLAAGLQPGGSAAAVGDARARDTLSIIELEWRELLGWMDYPELCMRPMVGY